MKTRREIAEELQIKLNQQLKDCELAIIEAELLDELTEPLKLKKRKLEYYIETLNRKLNGETPCHSLL